MDRGSQRLVQLVDVNGAADFLEDIPWLHLSAVAKGEPNRVRLARAICTQRGWLRRGRRGCRSQGSGGAEKTEADGTPPNCWSITLEPYPVPRCPFARLRRRRQHLGLQDCQPFDDLVDDDGVEIEMDRQWLVDALQRQRLCRDRMASGSARMELLSGELPD